MLVASVLNFRRTHGMPRTSETAAAAAADASVPDGSESVTGSDAPASVGTRAGTRASAELVMMVRGTVFGKVSVRGAIPSELDRLATFAFSDEDASPDSAGAARGRGLAEPSCIVCFDDFQVGEQVRVLPCGHRFHVRCIDPWLLLRAECPVCHKSIRVGVADDVQLVVRTLSEATHAAASEAYSDAIRAAIASLLPPSRNDSLAVDSVVDSFYQALSDTTATEQTAEA